MALTEQFTLAIDAMGGDGAPDMVVEGMEIAAERHPGARFLLVGDETRLQALLARYQRAAAVCTIRHSTEVIAGDLKPTKALRSAMPGASPPKLTCGGIASATRPRTHKAPPTHAKFHE